MQACIATYKNYLCQLFMYTVESLKIAMLDAN